MLTPDPVVEKYQLSDAEPWFAVDSQQSSNLAADAKYLLKEKKVAPPPSVQQKIKLDLLGFVEEKGDVVAIIEIDGQSKRYSVGDLLADGSTLEGIVDHAIMLTKNGEVRVIPLYQ